MRQISCLLVIYTTLALAFPGLAAEDSQSDKRPNILFALADDWAWPHAGAYGDPVVKTPTFDRLAKQGVLFNYAYSAAPSCTASRGAALTGQAPHRLLNGANLFSILPARFKTYPDLLEKSGYCVGMTRKGWAPGSLEGSGRTRNPAGPAFRDFRQFLGSVPPGKPFCFWFGSTDPHRAYVQGSGVKSGMDPAKVAVPPWLPDTPTVRSDILDYYFAIQRFDREVGEMLTLLEQAGKLENTLVVVSGDNGMPFPRAKANVYDFSDHQPMAVCWLAKIRGGRTVDDFVSFTDLAPTLLEAAGLKLLPEMTGRSFLDVLLSGKSGRVDPRRDKVFAERERHAPVRAGNLSYPCRMVRDYEFLYIRNLRPQLWPAGDPVRPDYAGAMGPFGDIDNGPSKTELLARRDERALAPFFQRACAKRPAEELYDLSKDPNQFQNVAGKPEYAEAQKRLRGELDRWMITTGDPRANGETDFWDKCPYVRPKPAAKRKTAPKPGPRRG